MDSANREEALKALRMAIKHFSAQPPNIATAKRLALKSVSLCDTSEAANLLERIRVLEEEQKSGASSDSGAANGKPAKANGSAQPSSPAEGHSTGAEPFAGSGGIKHRHADAAGSSGTAAKGKAKADDEKREYTPEQLAVVKRIRKCKVTEYYEIMSLKKDCEEADVKKAYRKLALQLHPDKNGAPGADEAFKMVSKAFQVLSDSSLRAAFDRDGGDPESRFGSGMRSGGGMRSPFTSNGGFEGELSPEDLFNMFFGGGFGGGGFGGGGFGPGVQFAQFGGSPFGGSPVFQTSFGPGGFRTTRARTRQATGNAGGGEQADRPRGIKGAILQLLPILIFLFMAFGSSFFDIIGSLFTTPDPSYSFVPTGHFSAARTTGGNMDIPYFLDPKQVNTHPYYAAPVVEHSQSQPANPPKERKSYGLRRFEKTVEERWVTWKYNDCSRAREKIDRQIDGHQGVFGFGTDWDAVKKLREQRSQIETCRELREKGYQV